VGRAAQVVPYLGLAAPAWFVAYKVMLTPLVEETLKAAPLLLRPVRQMITSRSSALWVGFVLGVSFGLGEAAFLAYGIAQAGVYNDLPWYAFTGYLNERLLACFAHGVLTAFVVTGIQRGGWSRTLRLWRSHGDAFVSELAFVPVRPQVDLV
jgi:RsiW-degrading membrane proteinase PrsW (M82 family)